MDTGRYLEALKQVVAKRYSIKDYNIGGYQEEAVCIQSDKSGWTVYHGERGNRMDEVRCDTVLMACLRFIRMLTHRVEDVSSMEDELITYLIHHNS